jgi:hypothetical protein
VTPGVRIAAVVAGIVTLLLAGAALVRQAAMAVDAGISWPIAGWWEDLTAQSSTATIAAAAVAAVITVLLIVFAYRQVSPGAGPEVIEFDVPDGTARLSVPALRKALRRRFEAMLPGSQVGEMAVRKDDDGWSVRLEANVPVCDLQDLHGAVLEAFRDDMRRVATIDLVRLDLIVTSMRPVARKKA